MTDQNGRTEYEVLQHLKQYGVLWTNPVKGESNHTTYEIGKWLIDKGYAVVTLRGEGYERLALK